MNDELTHSEITAVEEFAKGLQVCFENYRRLQSSLPIGGAFVDITIGYVLQTLEIHKQLAQIKFERYVNNLEKEVAKKE